MKTIAQQLNVKKFPFIIRDENGNELYYEDSSGFWTKSEYDENHNMLYFEDSDGFWEKREYDINCNEVYFETSYGDIIDNRVPTITKEEAEKKFNIKIK